MGRERERQSEVDSTLSAEPDVGLDPMTLRSKSELKPRFGCSIDCATQMPQGPQFLRTSRGPKTKKFEKYWYRTISSESG